MQLALDNAVKAINGKQDELNKVAGYMLTQLKTNNVDEAQIINGITGENATTLHSSTDAVINALSGEGGISGLLDSIGVTEATIADSTSKFATIDIASAINKRTPDPSVSGIKTDISTLKDSIGNDISGTLHDIEKSLGEFVKGKLKSDFTDGETAKGEENVAGKKAEETAAQNNEDAEAERRRQEEERRLAEQRAEEERKAALEATEKRKQELNALMSDLEIKMQTYTVAADERTGDIEDLKEKLKKVGRTSKKGKQILDLIEKKRAKREEFRTLKENAKKELEAVLSEYEQLTGDIETVLEAWAKANGTANHKLFDTFAKGTKRVPEDLLAWTNENADKIGPEMIVRPSDGAILTPMKAGDSVIPANLADNLFKWGAISPDKFITNPFVGKWSAEGGSSVTNNADYTAAPQTVEMHFDSLFHIEGNVDESVMPRLENLGKSLVNDKDFQKNVIKFVTKDFVRESKKQGIR